MCVLFDIGQLVATAGVDALMWEDMDFYRFVVGSYERHTKGDWGDLRPEDKALNDEALEGEGRLFSVYEGKYPIPKIWIITEADRSATTILFPSEY